jgi:hypothetical protein
MQDDGLEEIRPGAECPPGLHSDVPIIEGGQTVGLICTLCGRSVREDMAYSTLVATERGLVDLREQPHRRRDPRF